MNIAPTISEPKIKFLFELLNQIETGKLFVPKFQRGLVWTDDQRLDLLRSIKSGLPIGSLLLWETSQYSLASFDKIGGVVVSPFLHPAAEGVSRTYLLDGFQRLSTLFGAMKHSSNGPHLVDDRDWGIFYDLETEDFILQGRNPLAPTWMPANALADETALMRFWLTLKGEEKLIKRSSQLAKVFLSYKIALVTLETDDLDRAITAFHRINSSGTPMSEIDMVAALTWSKDFDFREKIERLKEDKLNRVGWEKIDNNLILTAGKIVLGRNPYEPDESLIEHIKNDPELIDKAVANIVAVARFMAKYCGIESVNLLPYPCQIILLGMAIRLFKNSSEHKFLYPGLRDWFWRTSYTEEFNEESKVVLNNAIADILKLVKEEYSSQPMVSKIKPLPKLFDSQTVRAKLLILRLAELRPQHVPKHVPISVSGHQVKGETKQSELKPQQNIPGHPGPTRTRYLNTKQLLKERGMEAAGRLISSNQLTDKSLYRAPENLFIVDNLRKFQERLVYWKSTFSEDFLNSHAISPAATVALKQGNYDEFLKERRKTLIEMEKAFIQPLGLDYEEEQESKT